jgi:hypothetical protein
VKDEPLELITPYEALPALLVLTGTATLVDETVAAVVAPVEVLVAAATATTVSSTSVAVPVNTNRAGSASYGVINSSGSSFTPNVQVVVSGAQN